MIDKQCWADLFPLNNITAAKSDVSFNISFLTISAQCVSNPSPSIQIVSFFICLLTNFDQITYGYLFIIPYFLILSVTPADKLTASMRAGEPLASGPHMAQGKVRSSL